MHFNWEEYGFQLSVPDLYLIYSPERSQKEVTIEIEHCVRIGDLQFWTLQTSVTSCSIEGGKFLTKKAVWDTAPCS